MEQLAPSDAVVVPLGPTDAGVDPWELLARNAGMLVSRVGDEAPAAGTWRKALRAGSTFSTGIREIADRPGLYRLDIPTGYGTHDLVHAIGGGLRAGVRGPGGRIVGQATLRPVGRIAASGPLIGVMALSIATEMIAGDQQAETLNAIRDGVDRLNARFDMEDDARLDTAAHTITQAHAALLDGAVIPESVGLGAAMTNLLVLRHRSVSMLSGWEQVVQGASPSGTSGSALRAGLGEVGKVGWEGFPAAVRTAYASLVLDCRRIMLVAAEAQVRHPDLPLSALHEIVEDDIAARRAELDRLRTVLSRLSTLPLHTSAWSGGVLPNRVSDAAIENSRTQALFATLARALSDRGSAVHDGNVSAEVRADGSVRLLRPA